MPDKLLVLFSSLCQTVKLFSNPDSEQQIIWACIWPIDVNNICIYEQPHAPLHFSMINLNVIFHPLSGSALQIVLVVIHLFLLRDENMSWGWIIWIIELRAGADCARMMEAWIHSEQITSKVSDLFRYVRTYNAHNCNRFLEPHSYVDIFSGQNTNMIWYDSLSLL